MSKLSAVHRMSTPTRHRTTHSTSDVMCSPNVLPPFSAKNPPTLPQVVTTSSPPLNVPRSVRSVSYTFSSQVNTDDEDDDTTLDRESLASKYNGLDEEPRNCGIADSLCGFGCRATQSRQVPTERPPKYERRLQELQSRNQQLHYQNQSLHQENVQMNQAIRLTSTTSDQTVLTLQQRCQTAEYKNVQYEKELTLLKQQLESDAKAPDQLRNFSSVDEATAALLNQRDDTIAELRQQCLQYSQQLTLVQDLAHRNEAVTDSTSLEQPPKQNQKQQISDLEAANYQLEVELREAIDHMEHKTEYYNDTIRELEDKYGQMERQVLESKLQLAAANEVQEQLMEDHQLALQTLKEENDKLLNDLSVSKKDRDLLMNDKEQLIDELKRSLAAANEAKELMMSEYKSTVQSMEESKLLLIQELSGLKQELAHFFELKKEDEKKTEYDDGLDIQLRAELQQSRQTIDELRRELSHVDAGSNGGDDDQQPIADSHLLQIKVDDLTSKVKKLKKGLLVAKNENSRFRTQLILKSKNPVELKSDQSIDTDETVDIDDESAMSESSIRRLLKERDDAISSLVKQAVGQDMVIVELRSEIEVLNSKITNATDRDISPDVETVQQLQREAEVFASQVIELDAEIEQLKSTIVTHELHVADLEHQLENTKVTAPPQLLPGEIQLLTNKIHDLEAEIDELKEANLTQQDELRNLRRKVWNTASVNDEVAKAQSETLATKREVTDHLVTIDVLIKEKTMLSDELSTVRTTKAELEQQLRDALLSVQKSSAERISALEEKLDECRWLYDELKASPSHMSEEAVVALRDEMHLIRQNLTSQTEDLRKAHATVKELEEILADQNAKCAADFEEEKEELLAEIESLTHRLNDAQDRITELEADTGIIDDFKEKLERADLAREESEKNIVDTFDRRMSLLTLDKDLTIDKLRKELMIEKQTKTEEMEELTAQLKVYQVEISELREEMAEQIEHREARIFALEATLTAQEQLVTTMKTEMDHLQSSMEGSVARRKDENDEMQQELLTLTAAAGKQEREITSLKLELEAKTLEYQSVIAKLEHKVAVLEKTPSELRNAQDLQMELRVKEVKDRLEKLKWRNTSLKEENLNLRERLEQAELLAKANSDSDRMKELEDQLSKQLLKVKTLESELRSTREPPADEPSSISTTRDFSNGDAVSTPSNRVDDGSQVSSATRSTKKPPKAASTRSASPVTSVSSSYERLSAPSPPRRGMKLFGRK
jgi:hypothetical protein